jgi:hypothetical protein
VGICTPTLQVQALRTPTYTDSTAGTANTNLIVLGTDGWPSTRDLAVDLAHRMFILADSSNVTIATYDNSYGIPLSTATGTTVPTGGNHHVVGFYWVLFHRDMSFATGLMALLICGIGLLWAQETLIAWATRWIYFICDQCYRNEPASLLCTCLHSKNMSEIDLVKYGVLWQKVEDYERRFDEMGKKMDKMEGQLEQLIALSKQRPWRVLDGHGDCLCLVFRCGLLCPLVWRRYIQIDPLTLLAMANGCVALFRKGVIYTKKLKALSAEAKKVAGDVQEIAKEVGGFFGFFKKA